MEEEETGLLSTDKTVQIDVIANHIRYAGMAIVRPDRSVDLSSIIDDEDLAERRVYYNGTRLCSLKTLLYTAARNAAGLTGCAKCEITGYILPDWDTVTLQDGRVCAEPLAREFQGEYYLETDGREGVVHNEGGCITRWAPEWYWNEEMYWCEQCQCYVSSDDYYGDGVCCFCHEESNEAPVGVIEGYCESHEHTPVLFGEYESEDKFQGLGFELEVDTTDDEDLDNYGTAEHLCEECGLEENEMRYAHDGSLSYGFECISQPHTVKAFWDNAPKWRKMLSYLSARGYESHNPGTCGLHVHVSRTMFGDTVEEQDKAIAKVYVFFDENWDDLVKVSRRRDTEYCGKLSMNSAIAQKKATKYNKWKENVKINKSQNHYVALNNGNKATFEYRLGRGTLNAWSFFSWIDLMLTITKNAKRITVNKVNSNDIVSWLGGIKESTAKYIYKRGAFRQAVLSLYPSIEWETDLTDNSNY
jgi:hypothetical protein